MAAILDTLKWPVVVLILAAAVLWMFKDGWHRLVESLSKRKIKIPGGAELESEPAAQQAVELATRLPHGGQTNTNPIALEAGDSPYFKTVVQAVTQNAAAISFHSDNERERWLMREGAALVLQLDFERIYRAIWESQLGVLTAANNPGGIQRAELAAYFEHRTKEGLGPPGDTLDRWLGYLIGVTLVEVQVNQFTQTECIVTTERGRLFLTYLIREGLDLRGLHRGR